MWVACGDKKKDRFIRSQKIQALVHWTFNTKLLEKGEQKEHSKRNTAKSGRAKETLQTSTKLRQQTVISMQKDQRKFAKTVLKNEGVRAIVLSGML